MFALGDSSRSSSTSKSATSSALKPPGGQILIVVIGLVILGIGVWFDYKGISRRFTKDLAPIRSHTMEAAVELTCITGHVAKGVALGAVGVLVAWAGLREQPEQASGMDAGLCARYADMSNI